MYPNIQPISIIMIYVSQYTTDSTITVDVFQYTTNYILCNNAKLILHTK